MTEKDKEIQELWQRINQLEGESAALQRFIDSIIESESYYLKHNISCPELSAAIDEAIGRMTDFGKENSNW